MTLRRLAVAALALVCAVATTACCSTCIKDPPCCKKAEAAK